MYQIPSLEQIRDGILADWRNLDPQTNVASDSDNYVRASGFASAVLGLYQYVTWGINQFFPDTAELDSLVRFATARGLSQKSAASAVGTINFTGAAGAAIAAGTTVQTADGQQYQTTVVGAIGGAGSAAIAAQALIAGTISNQPDNTPGVLQSAPPGVDAAVVLANMSGGAEAESAASLLARVLDLLRQPPAGGNKYDYPRWAREVDGVTSAFCYPLRRGGGTVDVAILSNGLPPGAALLAAVTSYIADRCPAEADFMVLAPQPVPCAVTATVVLDPSTTLAAVQAAANDALTAYFATLTPGSTAVRSRILAIISDTSGVTDVTLTLPAANLATTVDATHVQLPTLGVVTIGV